MAISSSKIRLIAAIVGGVNLALLLFVFAAPYWRTTAMQGQRNAYNNIWGYEGLWVECASFFSRETQCYQIGQLLTQPTNQNWVSSRYYQYGVYANLDAYRAFMIIALVASLIAFSLSLAGMKCSKALKENSATKRWINIAAGILHITAGVLTGVAVSWYAAEVVREYYSPLYQTTRIKYTLGACLFFGWISMLVSLGLGCVLTCCTCFNQPVDRSAYAWKPPITENDALPQHVESVMVQPEHDSFHDEWDDDTSRYTDSRRSERSHKSHRSHKSERSHRSHKSHRSHRSHRSRRNHESSRQSDRVDDYDHHNHDHRESSRDDDGFV